MNKIFTAVLAVAAMTSPLAYAEEQGKTYAGVAITSPSQARMVSRTGQEVVDSSRVGAKIYGGINFTEHVSLEAGVASFGSHTLKNAGPGAGGDTRLASDMVYVAVKGSTMIGERVALFGKTGMAHTRVSASGTAVQDMSITRVMVGLGAQYRITPTLAATLEIGRYGGLRTMSGTALKLNKMEAGLKLSF